MIYDLPYMVMSIPYMVMSNTCMTVVISIIIVIIALHSDNTLLRTPVRLRDACCDQKQSHLRE